MGLMTRILGIDVGTKTLGLAISDEGGTVAFPVQTLQRKGLRRDVEALADLATERDVEEVVVGLPLNLDGTPGRLVAEAETVAGRLAERTGLPVHLSDERLTTAAAERVLLQADVSRRRRKQVVDKLAATLILQAFLDRRLLGDAADVRRGGVTP
jgi:putative Holliday junction resolvase